MTFDKSKKAFVIIGTVLLPLATAGALFFGSSDLLKPSKADGTSIVLDENLQPTLDGSGEGTLTDNKNVVWNYHNAKTYAAGHVSLDNGGYFGVSTTSAYGITGITTVTINYSAGSDGELWLLRSIDGTTWTESALLKDVDDITSTTATSTSANGYRYIRFFFDYDSNDESIDIDSVTISYSCTGVSETEDIDSAKKENVIATSDNITYERETTNISPNSIGGEAIAFQKADSKQSTITLGFGKTYRVGDVQNEKVEFDIKTSMIAYGKTVQLMNGTTGIGATVDSNKHSTYKITNIQDDWYHVEVAITSFISTISGYNGEDLPKGAENKNFNGIKINAGTCVIDNLRISTTSCELGTFNNPTYAVTAPSVYWLKIAWVGKLRSCTFEFSGDPIGSQIPLNDPKLENGSPFYIEWSDSGTATVTATLVVGYNKQVQTLVKTITVN